MRYRTRPPAAPREVAERAAATQRGKNRTKQNTISSYVWKMVPLCYFARFSEVTRATGVSVEFLTKAKGLREGPCRKGALALEPLSP